MMFVRQLLCCCCCVLLCVGVGLSLFAVGCLLRVVNCCYYVVCCCCFFAFVVVVGWLLLFLFAVFVGVCCVLSSLLGLLFVV